MRGQAGPPPASNRKAKGQKKTKQDAKEKVSTAAQEDAVTPVVLTFGILLIGGYSADNWFFDPVEGRMAFLPRAFYFMTLHSVAAQLMALVMLQFARWLDGEVVDASTSWMPSAKEMGSNDASIQWPYPVEAVSPDLLLLAKKCNRKEQPFFLNHQTGSRRRRDMFMRIGMMLGTVITISFCAVTVDRGHSAHGINTDAAFFSDTCTGVAVGVFIVGAMFAVELAAGWIRFHCLFEVFDHTREQWLFTRNIVQEVVFHLSVSINEEVPMRGW
jgi:hypothetical protein